MAKAIKIRKGLNISIKGKAEERIVESSNPELFAIKPTDFSGLVPKMVLKEGAKVKVGTVVFHDKYNEEIKYVSPVSGEIKEIVRGEKRKILSIVFKADKEFQFETFDTSGDAKEVLLKSGLWSMIQQRPLAKVANPSSTPKAIFVSGFDSHPLAPYYEYLLRGQQKDLQAGFDVLKQLTKGKVQVTVHNSDKSAGVFAKLSGIELNSITGKHPAGNVGTQIHHIDPVNKGETVWTVNALDVLTIGKFFKTGQLDLSKVIAVTGSEIKTPAYYKTWQGASLSNILDNNIEGDNVRIISGNALTGTKVEENGYLGGFDHQITVIQEGDDYKFSFTQGWQSIGLNKLSSNRIYPSSMFKKKEFNVDTNTNGEERAFVVTGEYEKVFPFDIPPVYLIKAVITNDIDAMENLGIYEIAPEDFALCEFVCTSKINSQKIIRDGLNVIEAECM
jgi:Na+-transporting NADH:ubiquinone oxidoreductase subunit A